jgi:alpha-methylacyl-CoA racemase
MLDSGVHFYETYRTSDDQFMSVGCIEPHFYAEFLAKLGLTDDDLPQFDDFDELKQKVGEIFRGRTREDWCRVFDGSDACVTPVLGLVEAAHHPQNVARLRLLVAPLT